MVKEKERKIDRERLRGSEEPCLGVEGGGTAVVQYCTVGSITEHGARS